MKRQFRIFKIGSTQVASETVPSPTHEAFEQAFKKPTPAREERLREQMSRTSPIGPAPSTTLSSQTIAPPPPFKKRTK
jgi:hypothetical protein